MAAGRRRLISLWRPLDGAGPELVDGAEAALTGVSGVAPEAAGLNVVLGGLSMVCPDEVVIELTSPVFDGLYEYFKRSLLLGTEPV